MAGFNINSSFEIDAAKLIAKLHRGACETHKDMLFFNSGITDDEKITPEQCEKSKIGFDTGLGEYELGVIAQSEIECKLKHNGEEILDKMTETKKENDEKAKITDNPDQKTNESGVPSFMSFLKEDDKKKEDAKAAGGEVLVDPFTEPKDADDEVKKMIKENQDELQKVIDTAVKNAVQYLKDYMTVFAGKDEAGKIAEKSVVKTYLSADVDPTKFQYKDGKIEGLSDEDRLKAWHEELKKKPDIDVYVIKNLCCKVAYKLDMES